MTDVPVAGIVGGVWIERSRDALIDQGGAAWVSAVWTVSAAQSDAPKRIAVVFFRTLSPQGLRGRAAAWCGRDDDRRGVGEDGRDPAGEGRGVDAARERGRGRVVPAHVPAGHHVTAPRPNAIDSRVVVPAGMACHFHVPPLLDE